MPRRPSLVTATTRAAGRAVQTHIMKICRSSIDMAQAAGNCELSDPERAG